MTTRRGFLWLCGATGAGIYLAKAGLIELPKQMVLQMAGRCSFCGKDKREVFGIAGVVGRATRICDECVGLCFDILNEEMELRGQRTQGIDRERSNLSEEVRQAILGKYGLPPSEMASGSSAVGLPSTDDELEKLLHPASTEDGADPRELILAIRARLAAPSEGPHTALRDFHCSFCDRARQDVRKLISGPRVFICDDCTGDAGGLFAASGWRFKLSA
jgi:hypothetical protein